MISLLTAAMLCAGSCNRATEMRYDGIESSGEPHSIAHLKSLCTGSSRTIREEIAVSGRVTGNDRYGEFVHMLVLEDESGGICLFLDGDRLADEYPFGSEVTVSCNGLTLCQYGGKVQLGATPGDYGAGRISQEYAARCLRTGPPPAEAPRPVPAAIPEIGSRHIDTYIRLDGVRFTGRGSWCDSDPVTGAPVTTEHTIADDAGNTFTVRTAGTCIYANEPLPSGTGSLCGIVDCFNGKYSLRITNCEVRFVNAGASPTTAP